MASFSPKDILPPMQWQIFAVVLNDIAQSDISALTSTLFDEEKGEKLTSQRVEALKAIKLSDMEFIDHPDSAEFEVKTETHSIRFSNRSSTRGELRGKLLKKILQQYKLVSPSRTLEKTLLAIATSLETNSFFNYLISSWRSTPDLSLKEKDVTCLIQFSHYCYSQIKKGEKLDEKTIQEIFNEYYYDYNQLQTVLDKLHKKANSPLRLINSHLSNFLSIVPELKEINIEVGNLIQERLTSWKSSIDDFSRGDKSFSELIESHQKYYVSIKENLKKVGLPLSEATEQLNKLTNSLEFIKWVRLWSNCVEAYLKGKIPLQEFKKDSSFFCKDLANRFPKYKKSIYSLHNNFTKSVPRLKTSRRNLFHKSKSSTATSNIPVIPRIYL